MKTRAILLPPFLLLGLLSPASPAAATKVKIFRAQSRSAFLLGTLDGVSVDALGRLRLADRVDRLAAVGEPFLLSAAVHPEGWVVGTGNDGRVLVIDRRGTAREIFKAPEPEIFAVRADPDGTVFAGSSPGGKVYRIGRDGGGETFFDPGETYIWALGRDLKGALLVATGTQGKLFRVNAAGRGEVLHDSDDTHLRSLEVLSGGDVLLGTAGEGLILRLDEQGRVRTLFDAEAPEVVALAGGPGGSAYAALVNSEATFVGPSPPSASGTAADSAASAASAGSEGPSGGSSGQGEPGGGQAVVTITTGVSSTPASGGGPRSEVVRISSTGLVESVTAFDAETVFDLLWLRDRLWIATGLEGKLYSFDGNQLVLEKDVDERQVVALLADDPGPAFATTNAAAFYRVVGGTERRGLYTSPPLDAGQISRFGTFHWQGEAASGGGERGGSLRFSFRSGMSAEPDRTWSEWTAPKNGPELSLAEVPHGRYVQWRGELASGDGSPVLQGAELSYLQENLAPRIEKLDVLAPGQILVPSSFNPAAQVYEPSSPNRDGIFTTLKPASSNGEGRLKALWKKGFRTLRWKAEDPNGDSLVYRLEFRLEGPGEPDGGAGGWRPVAEDLEEDYYSFDATVLPDGIYRFRLAASDREDNAEGGDRKDERISEPVVVDHRAPRLGEVSRRGRDLEVPVIDDLSPLAQAMVSIDAGEWRSARVSDGLLDARRETLRIEVPEGAGLVLLRLLDASHNVATFDLSGQAR